MLLPALGLGDQAGRHDGDARRQPGDPLLKPDAAPPLVAVSAVHVHVLHTVLPVVRASSQHVDAAVQHGDTGLAVTGGEGGH